MRLPTIYQEYIHLSRYARWDYKEKRRETWDETVERYFNFFEEWLAEKNNYKLENGQKLELENAVKEDNLRAFKHYGFWQCMDTRRDKEYLEKLCKDSKPPWSI